MSHRHQTEASASLGYICTLQTQRRPERQEVACNVTRYLTYLYTLVGSRYQDTKVYDVADR